MVNGSLLFVMLVCLETNQLTAVLPLTSTYFPKFPEEPFNAQDRGNWGTGHGWAGAQQVFWNCQASSICVQQPPTAQNYAIGCKGKIDKGRFQDRNPGYYESHGEHVKPRSLYLRQLEDRLGSRAVENVTTDAQRNGTIYHVLKKELAQ